MRTVGKLAAVGGVTGVAALGGALGLVGGSLDLGDKVTARLPFQSPVFAGMALAVVVGLPTLVLAGLALRHDSRTDVVAVGAGFALICWIAVQLAVIREFSWLQAVFVVVGASLMLIGLRDAARRR